MDYTGENIMKTKNNKVVAYNKWGYIFLIPFFVIFFIFQLIPLVNTIYNSFFENYKIGLSQVGPRFVGLGNYVELITKGHLLKYAGNTMIMWLIGFIPQIFISLLLAAWFTDPSLRLKGQRFFKTVIYLPNLIMAAAFSMLFFTLFASGKTAPVNSILLHLNLIKEPIKFFTSVACTRGLVGTMNFLMWFGNTTILLMAGMMGIDQSLFEAAEVDGATSTQILTDGKGGPVESTMTMIMELNVHLYSKNLGLGGALSVILFIVTGILSFLVYKMTMKGQEE